VSALIVAGVILAAALMSMDLSGGPFQGAVGTVKSVGRAGGDGGGEVATVALSDGRVVQAAVLHPGDAAPGQSVHVRAYRRFLSGDTTYEILRMKDSATK
jgi:hypothetical protein